MPASSPDRTRPWIASRHYLGRWFDDPDDLVGLIRAPWIGGRPFLPDGLAVIDRVPGHNNAFVATGHGTLGVTLGSVTGRRLAVTPAQAGVPKP